MWSIKDIVNKVNNKDIKTTPGVILAFLLLTYFTSCSSVSIVNFDEVNAGWVVMINPFYTTVLFLYPWKHNETRSFLMFSGVIEETNDMKRPSITNIFQ